MLENKISNRLKFLIDFCPNYKTYADIGCDHGYVALNLIGLGTTDFVYCVDIHKLSLEKAKNLFEKHNVIQKAKFYCSDGFSKLSTQEKKSIDCAIIAGMGGNETIKILTNYQTKSLVLQPMHNQRELREFLIKNGYNIVKDLVFCEKNKFYTFLYCEKSIKQTIYTDFELEFGKYSNTTDYINYLKTQKDKYLKIYNKTNNNAVLNILQNIENVLK